MKMRSTISMKLIIKLLLILCAYNCACWTTTLAIQPPSHQKQQIVELLSEDAKPIFKSPSEELDQLQVTERRRPSSPPPPRRSPPPPPPRRSPPPPPPPPRRSPPPPPMRSPPPPPQQPSPPPPFEVKYPTVSFELIHSTAKTYNDFILKIRNALKGPDAKFNIPMMRNPDTITDSNRFLLVKLSVTDEKQKYSTTLAVRVSDGYMVGYCCGKYDQKAKKDTAWFFTPDTDIFKEQNKLLFNGKDVSKQELGFKGNYDSLPDRDSVQLGWTQMANSITALANTEKKQDMRAVENAAVILIQMVLEATRYGYISDKVATAVQDYIPITPDPLMLSYQNNWGTLSEAVATSVGEGVFKDQVELKDDDGKVLKTVGYVWQIRDDLSLLGFVKT